MAKHKYDCIGTLCRAGFTHDEASALRRISMTLHNWHEHECNGTIQRDEASNKPYAYNSLTGKRMYAVADKETGAIKRLNKILSRYPAMSAFVQGDPRGASLYILRAGDVPEGQNADAYYSRGIVVY